MCNFYRAGLFLYFLLEELHGIGLGLLGNLDIGLHGLIVGVAGPFHYHLRRDALYSDGFLSSKCLSDILFDASANHKHLYFDA